MTPIGWSILISIATGLIAVGLWQFRIAAAMCADEFEEGERSRLREEDATPR